MTSLLCLFDDVKQCFYTRKITFSLVQIGKITGENNSPFYVNYGTFDIVSVEKTKTLLIFYENINHTFSWFKIDNIFLRFSVRFITGLQIFRHKHTASFRTLEN